VDDASLRLEERMGFFDCIQESRVAVGADEFQGFAYKTLALEVYQPLLYAGPHYVSSVDYAKNFRQTIKTGSFL
jgi:hypothetical protein